MLDRLSSEQSSTVSRSSEGVESDQSFPRSSSSSGVFSVDEAQTTDWNSGNVTQILKMSS